MPDFDVNRYAQAWANHVKVRGDDAEAYLSAFLEQYTEDATYTDVPSGQRFAGHSALADAARHISTELDTDIDVLWAVADDSHFAIEYEAVIRQGGSEVRMRGVAAGDVRDGRVCAHRSYYDGSALSEQSSG